MKVYIVYGSECYGDTYTLCVKDSEEKAKTYIKDCEDRQDISKANEKRRDELTDEVLAFIKKNKNIKRDLDWEEDVKLEDLYKKRCLTPQDLEIFEHEYTYYDSFYYRAVDVE